MLCSIQVTFIGTASKRERIYLKLFMLRIISHIMPAEQPVRGNKIGEGNAGDELLAKLARVDIVAAVELRGEAGLEEPVVGGIEHVPESFRCIQGRLKAE